MDLNILPDLFVEISYFHQSFLEDPSRFVEMDDFDIDNELDLQDSIQNEMDMLRDAENEYMEYEEENEDEGKKVSENQPYGINNNSDNNINNEYAKEDNFPTSTVPSASSRTISQNIPKNSTNSTNVTNVPFDDIYPKKKANLTPAQLAVELQAMRKVLDLQNVNLKHTNTSLTVELITSQPLIKKDAQSNVKKFLHARPDINEINRTHANRTCILDNGTKFFLRKRENFHGNRGSDRASGSAGSSSSTSGIINEKNEKYGVGNLLSRSMNELLKEADNMKIKTLAKKEKYESEEREKESHNIRGQFNRNNGNEGDSDFLIPEKSLWVDKYSPKVFSQLLSPEKINREVLKALKLWHEYVFRERKTVTPSAIGAATFGLPSVNDQLKSPKKKDKKRKIGEKDDDNEEDERDLVDHKKVSQEISFFYRS